MTATAAPTDKEADRRELPGDGKTQSRPPHRQNRGRAPCRWFDAGGSQRWSRSEPWSDGDDLKAGEARFEEMGAPTSDGTSGRSRRHGSTQPRTCSRLGTH